MSLFCAYFLKALILSVNYPEAAILAVLGASACYFYAKDSDSKIKSLDEKLTASNKSLEEKLQLANRNFETRVNEVEGIKAQLNAIKVNGIFKPLNEQRQNVR